MAPIACPRCGHKDTFTTGYLPDTCVCRVCQSQLDWREIPGMGPGCVPLDRPDSLGDSGGSAGAPGAAGTPGTPTPPAATPPGTPGTEE